jgi:hypothetical protein
MMAQLHRLYHLMRADFYERARRYSFLITLGLVVVVAYFYLPPPGVRSIGLELGNHRGVYNSAWVGGSVAVLCLMLLSLPAFYLVKNAIERDERTRVGQILATTPLSKPLYTLGKAFSNFVFLAVMVSVIAVAGAAMMRDTAAAFPDYEGSFVLGGGDPTAPMQTFVWEGIDWTAGILFGRLIWLGLAMGLGLLAAVFFRRFDPAPARIKRARKAAALLPGKPAGSPEREEPVVPARPVSLTPVASRFRPRRGALLLAEGRLLFKGTPWWWFLVALGLIIAGITVPANALRWLLVAAWLWPLALWSSMGCREARHHTQQLVFSAPHLLGRQLPALWLAGAGIAITTFSLIF